MIKLFACFVLNSQTTWDTIFHNKWGEGLLCQMWIYKATRLFYLSNLKNSNDKPVQGLSLLFIIVSGHQTQRGEQSFRDLQRTEIKWTCCCFQALVRLCKNCSLERMRPDSATVSATEDIIQKLAFLIGLLLQLKSRYRSLQYSLCLVSLQFWCSWSPSWSRPCYWVSAAHYKLLWHIHALHCKMW